MKMRYCVLIGKCSDGHQLGKRGYKAGAGLVFLNAKLTTSTDKFFVTESNSTRIQNAVLYRDNRHRSFGGSKYG
jgi:hypothetical protein